MGNFGAIILLGYTLNLDSCLRSLLFFRFELALQFWFIPVMSVMLPVIIVEAILGAIIGYEIFRRVEKIV
jgi:hypothetical protein